MKNAFKFWILFIGLVFTGPVFALSCKITTCPAGTSSPYMQNCDNVSITGCVNGTPINSCNLNGCEPGYIRTLLEITSYVNDCTYDSYHCVYSGVKEGPACIMEVCSDPTLTPGTGCVNTSTDCYDGGVEYYTCDSCLSGYSKFYYYYQDFIDQDNSKPCYITATSCVCNGECFRSDCKDDTAWSYGGIGYEKKVFRKCSCNECNETPINRCIAEYYGNDKYCTKCPLGTSDLGNNETKTKCYLPAGWTGAEIIGDFKYNDRCYYTL